MTKISAELRPELCRYLQQNDDDDVRERREEEIVRDIRAVRLDRPQ